MAEETGNNLSYPVIWSEGVGLPIPGDPRQFNLEVADDVNGDGAINEQDKINGWYIFAQKVTDNTWQADSVSLTADEDETTSLFVTLVDWGDSLESRPIQPDRPARIEVTFYKDLLIQDPAEDSWELPTELTSYPMTLLANPSSPDEEQGMGALPEVPGEGSLDALPTGVQIRTEQLNQATVYSPDAQLVIQEVTDPDQAEDFVWVDADADDDVERSQWVDEDPDDGIGILPPKEEIPFGGEVNVGGKVIYGNSMGPWQPDEGDYRLTVYFPLDGNLQLDQAEILVPEEEDEEEPGLMALDVEEDEGDGPPDGVDPPTGGGVAYIDGENNLTYLDLSVGGDEPGEELPLFSVFTLDADKLEGDAGPTEFSFRVTPSGVEDAVSVDWTVSGSGADPADADDFVGAVLPSGTLEFTSNEVQILTIEVNGDLDFEADEGFTVTLVDSDSIDLIQPSAQGTIRNDDAPPNGGGGDGGDGDGGDGDDGSTAQPPPFVPCEQSTVITGDQFDNLLEGTPVTDYISGRAGNDTLLGFACNDYLLGESGNDFLSGGLDADYLLGEEGADFMNGNQGNDVLRGGDNDDVLRGGQDNDFLNGNAGDDSLLGDLGNDVVRGGRGDDTVNGNAGNDVLYGDLGADFFLLSKNSDLIADFSLAQGDTIGIVSGQEYSLQQSGANLLILRELGTTTLANVDLAAFEAADAIVLV